MGRGAWIALAWKELTGLHRRSRQTTDRQAAIPGDLRHPDLEEIHTLMKNKRSTWSRMSDWDKTWQGHEWPAWLPKLARTYLRTLPNYYHEKGCGNHSDVNNLFHSKEFEFLFDHWGRRGTAKSRTLITMPYCNDRKKVELFAFQLGLSLISEPNEPGAWHPNTFLFEFSNPVDDF